MERKYMYTRQADKACSSYIFENDTASGRKFGLKDKLKKRLLSAACAAAMMLANVGNVLPLRATAEGDESAVSVTECSSEAEVTTDSEELCHKSIELHPNGEQAEEVITLDGMMPEDATAKAVDVSGEHEGIAYDITINDGSEEYQPDEENPIQVEIVDPRITSEGDTELWHIHDDGVREPITEFTVSEGSVVFSAEGFSVYEIVTGFSSGETSDGDVDNISKINSARAKKGLYLYYGSNKFFTNSLNGNSALTETENIDSAAEWFITPEGDHYKISTKIGGVEKFIHNKSGNLLELSETQADLFDIYGNTGESDVNQPFNIKKSDEGKWLQHSNGGGGIRYFTDNKNETNSRIKMRYAHPDISEDGDPYNISGKSYGLFHYTDGATMGNAFMSKGASHSLVKLIITAHGSNKIYYVDQDNEITRWTFEYDTENGTYRLYDNSGSGKVYLHADSSGISTTANASDATGFDIEFKNNMIRLKSEGSYITYDPSSQSFGVSSDKTNDNTWLWLLGQSQLAEDDYVTFSADRVSVSDVKDGEKVVVYIRIWNETELRYDIYAVDHRGKLYPCYASGGKIMWLGDGTGSLEWTFTEYLDAVTKEPNFYYELYNSYSEKYLVPQLTKGQVLSDEPVGINMQGRRNGEFYSEIIAWERYSYIGMRPNAEKTALEPCSQSTCYPFYFARLEELNLADRLHKVPTIDNNDHGITMKMVDFDMSSGTSAGNYGNSGVAAVTNDFFGGTSSTGKLIRGMLSTDLKDNGYPEIKIAGSKNRDFSQIFAGAQTVNHLFLEREYNSSGYFDFDSCQNFATLKKTDAEGRAVKGSDGKTVFNTNDKGEVDFTVFRELGTHDRGSGETLQHGQFFPYDTIDPDIYSNKTNQYDSLKNLLDDDNPRKYEALHKIQTEEIKEADYYFGMELSASFVQTPSGLDAWGHDIVFEFTGDDDFWLYVDNELVLDLGGTHSALMGKVNFRTGEVTYDSNTSVSTHGTMTTKTLRQIFTENYLARNNNNTEGLDDYLAKYFAPGEDIFTDYSQHTMKIFYMERGGNASNLYMHFNLASVTPGHVVLSKEIEGDDKDLINKDFVEYPFQIYYTQEQENGTISEPMLLKNDNEHIRVTYQNSNQPVTFVDVYRPPGVAEEDAYQNVYFINPSKKAEISFPDKTMAYRLVECAVDKTVYNVLINDQPVPLDRVEVNNSNSNLVSYSSVLKQADEMPTISFQNVVRSGVIKDLYITKELHDEDGNIIVDDDSTFSFRLYLSTVEVAEEDLPRANMYDYYVLKKEGNKDWICRRDQENECFVKTNYVYSRENIEKFRNGEVTGVPVDDVVFKTSGFGAISGIPAGYTVCVPNLPVGTLFKVTEDIKTGYGLEGYSCEDGVRISDNVTTVLPSYDHEPGVDNLGRVVAEFDPRMNVYNKRGYSLTVNKKWSDLDITTAHSPIYVAVYADGKLIEDSVRQIKSPSVSAYYFWGSLVPNTDGSARTSLDGYTVKEVTLSNASPTVAKDGTVTNYGTVTPLESGNELKAVATRTAAATPEGESRDKEYDYVVSYSVGDDDGSNRTDTINNNRKGGIAVKLFKWKSYDPLRDGIFTLKDSDGNTIGRYTSDSEGTVVLLYDFERGKNYTLTQTAAPKGYVGLQQELCFKVNDDDSVTLYYEDGTTVWGTKTGKENEYDEFWAGQRPGENGITAYIDVFNKPFNFRVEKTDKEDPTLMLGSAHFALHKQANTSISGYVKNNDPMTGFEDMVTVNGVVDICGGDSGRVIYPGPNGSVYFLVETQAPFNYDKLDEDIVFRISPLGVPSIISDSYNGVLYEDEDGYVYTLSVPNEKSDKQMELLTINKKVVGALGDRSKEFTFTLTIEGADPDDSFIWAKNGTQQEDNMSYMGGTFTMKHNDRVEIALPAGVNVTVSEESGEYSSSFKLGDYDPITGSMIKFEFTESQDLMVTNTLNGVITTGVSSTAARAIALVGIPMISFGTVLWYRRKRKGKA